MTSFTAAFVAACLVGGAVAWAGTLSVTSKRLTVYRTCVIQAAATTTGAVLDSWVDEKNPTTAQDGSALMNVTSGPKSVNARIYVKFDLSRCNPLIGSSATVRSAVVRLYAFGLPGGCRTHDLFTVNGTWNETTIAWSGTNGQPSPATSSVNSPASNTRKSSINIGTCGNTTQGYVSGWDVATDVQAIASGTAVNNGWMIRDDSENAANNGTTFTTTYVSKAAGQVVASPQLIVTYST